jgi:hypothetical protein
MAGVPKAAHPDQRAALKQDLNNATLPSGCQDFIVKLNFRRFSPARAEASWLRSAYLAFFAALGYRFAFRPELDMLRKRLLEPNERTFNFRIIRKDYADEPVLTVIKSPEVFRSFAMVYGQHVVLLPLYGDAALYERLAQQPAGEVELKADGVYPWPDSPLFLHDKPSGVVV